MKKLLGIVILGLLFSGNSYAQERLSEWEGQCFIQFEGKVLIDDEICKMSTNDMPIEEKDDFLVVVSKPVLCDDGNEGCSYFFYAQQDKFLGKYFWVVNFNVKKDVKKAVMPFRLADIDYYEPKGGGFGVCFIDGEEPIAYNNKFCFEY